MNAVGAEPEIVAVQLGEHVPPDLLPHQASYQS